MKLNRLIAMGMSLIMCAAAISVSSLTAFAGSNNISSLPTTIKSYPVSTKNDTPAYSYQGAKSKSGTIYADDLCTINSIYSNGYLKVTYPTSGNKTRTLYVYSKDFFKATTYQKASITSYAKAYRRSSGTSTIGSVDSADKLVYVIGNAASNRYQICYKVTGKNYYKLGWVSTSVVKFNSGANTYSSNASKLLSKATEEINYHGTGKNGKGTGDYTKYGIFTRTNGKPWCASFVSWCADKTNVPKSTIPRTASCTEMANNSNSYVKWSSNALSRMKPGDVVFFASGSVNGTKRHVGIVSSITGNNVTVIEGNTSSDYVKKLTYTVNSNGYINRRWTYSGVAYNMYFSGYIIV